MPLALMRFSHARRHFLFTHIDKFFLNGFAPKNLFPLQNPPLNPQRPLLRLVRRKKGSSIKENPLIQPPSPRRSLHSGGPQCSGHYMLHPEHITNPTSQSNRLLPKYLKRGPTQVGKRSPTHRTGHSPHSSHPTSNWPPLTSPLTPSPMYNKIPTLRWGHVQTCQRSEKRCPLYCVLGSLHFGKDLAQNFSDLLLL